MARMDGYEIAAVLGAIGLLITTVVTAYGSLLGMRASRKAVVKVAEVHDLVNSRAKAQDEKIERLEAMLLRKDEAAIELAHDALKRAQDREAPVQSASGPQDVHVVNPAADPVRVQQQDS